MAQDFPKYSFADEMMSPREIGVRRDGSFDGIMTAVGGVNYYGDAIGFGSATGIAKMADLHQQPLGIRYFVKTGMPCSNGADMYEYVDLVPKGDFLGKRITNELLLMGLPPLRGLAPGILEDAATVLNPVPLIKAAAGGGYAKCKKVTRPVGDPYGKLRSRYEPDNVWIKDPTGTKNGLPHQTRWIFDKWISMEEWDAEPKTETPGTLPRTEAFTNPDINTSHIVAGVLLSVLAIGVISYTSSKH
jgi:hypothetical protein